MVKLIDALKVLPCDRNLEVIDYYSEETLYNGNYTFMSIETLLELSDREVVLIDTTKHDDNFEIIIVNENE